MDGAGFAASTHQGMEASRGRGPCQQRLIELSVANDMTGLIASDLSAFGRLRGRLLLLKEVAYEALPPTRRGAGHEDPRDYP